MTKKYYIITYGCQMNVSDSERIAAVLEKIGYKTTSKINGADLIVVNMCSVRQSAVDRVYGLIPKFQKLKIKKQPSGESASRPAKLKIVLTGCILKKDRKKFSEIFDYVLDIRTLPRFARQNSRTRAKHGAGLIQHRVAEGDSGAGLDSLRYKHKNLELKDLPKWPKVPLRPKSRDREILDGVDYLEIRPKCENKFSAVIPIMTGCNNFCSYCVVPYIRGREISRSAKEIICEVKNLVKRGYKEVWLLGQNVNSYKDNSNNHNSNPVFKHCRCPSDRLDNGKKRGKEINFPKLLKIVNDIPGNFWIRFTSPHPKDFSEELINTMAKCEKYGHYLNLPVQAGDDEILKRMNRNYTIAQYKNLVKKIRTKIPNITLSTDIIVGFPNETKKQFENSKKLFKEIKYDMAYISEYSPRPGTAAAKIKDDVPKKEKTRRRKILTEILKKTALKNNKRFLNKKIEVLAEESKKNFLIGKSWHYKTVKFEGPKNLVGKFVRVKIINALPWGLKGRLIND